jgi:hypothetical protein
VLIEAGRSARFPNKTPHFDTLTAQKMFIKAMLPFSYNNKIL